MQFQNVNDALRNGCVIRGFRQENGFVIVAVEKDGRIIASNGSRRPQFSGDAHPLEVWLRQGNSFFCRVEDGLVVFAAKGSRRIAEPPEVVEEAKLTGQPVCWQRGGVTYKTTFNKIFPSGVERAATSVESVAAGLIGPVDPWRETIELEGRAPTFHEAVRNAFVAVG